MQLPLYNQFNKINNIINVISSLFHMFVYKQKMTSLSIEIRSLTSFPSIKSLIVFSVPHFYC